MKNKIYKTVSVLLTFAIILSVFGYVIGTVSAATATYYVSAAGDDANAGTAVDTAVASYAKAIELANSSYGEGDTVSIKLTGESVDLGTIPEYAYDLVVEGIDETATKLSTTSSKGAIANNSNGKTIFKNVKFVSTQQYASFVMSSSKEIVFDSTASGFSSTKYATLGTYNDDSSSKTAGGQTVEFNSSVGIVYLGNSGWQKRTVTGDVNITVAGGGSPNFYFNPSTNSKLTLEKNLNLNIKKANTVSFTNLGSVTSKGAIQIINSTNATVTAANTVLAALDCNKYVIKNVTGKSDIIEFTETAGKFKVDTSVTDYEVIATDKEGNVTKVDSNGYLTLTKSGDYELSLYREPITAVYYISAVNGSQTEGDGSKAKPFLTISDAITQGVMAGYTNKDTVTVKLLDKDTIQWSETTITPAHPFKLIVESDDRNNYSSVNIVQATFLGGPTEVRYGVYKIVDTYSQLRLNNYDFTIGEGANFDCLYYTFGDNSTSNTIAGQNVVFKNDITSPNIYLSNNLHSNGKRYSADVNVTVDNHYAAPTIRLGGQAGTVYYDANVNLHIKNAATVSFVSQNNGKNVCNGAIQLITNSKTSVDPDSIEYLTTTCNPTNGFYHIINASKYKDLLNFTTTAGVYVVDTEKYEVTATDGTNVIKAKDGFLTLTKGTYTVTATQIKEDVVPVITEKLQNAVINLWEQANGELNIDNAESVATIDFGNKTYNDIKINILNAQKIIFSGVPTINGSLHIAVNGATTIEGKALVDAITAGKGKWYVVNNSGSDIGFGDEMGKVLYTASGKELEAVNGTEIIAPKFQNFLLQEGEYTIKVKSRTENQYNDYIEYRGSNLANTYAKIKNGEKLNVVYYGGSVTNGTGASSSNSTSWRALIGQWLKNTYQDVEINNINSAIGATGTTFGSYRLNRFVIEEKPDLFFIEFSINDFLDLRYTDSNYRERSAMQLETIIRQVREELPECDIIVLHTTNKNHIETARNGQLYAEAQAHHDIAEHYNIPTINIGGALANTLPEDWRSAWSEYIADDVHPTDKGYAIYYNVIKEYMSNCLLYTEHSGTITNYTMPEMVSESLLNGDIQYIDATRELLAKSEELGGTGFEYSAGETYLKKDFGSIVSTAGNDSVFAMEFIGTELTMAISGSSHLGGFKVKVDDGSYRDVSTVGVTPRYIVTGLASGKHTVYIKPVSSSSGTVTLRMIGFYSRNATKSTHKHTFSNYASDNNATCIKLCTETATCDYGCGETDTRNIPDSYAAHTYSNDCDKSCNQTGCTFTRTVGAHKYSNEVDKTCDNCNEPRTITDTHLIKEGSKYYYYVNGNKSTATDIVKVNSKYYYIKKGVWTKSTLLFKDGSNYYYVKDGVYSSKVTDLIKVSGKYYYIKKGKWSKTTLLYKKSGKYYYVKKGVYSSKVTDLIKVSGKYYYIKKGKWSKTTLLYKKSGKYYYVKKGVYSSKTNTLYKKSGKYYAIKSGKWYKSKAIIKYSGKKYYVNKGYAQLKFSGKVKIGKKTYTIKKGVVK